MVFEYHTNFPGPVSGVLWAAFGAVLTVTVLVGLALFLLRGWALHTMALRRGLHHAWLSWLPVGQDWIRGSISDQYRYLTQGRIQRRRMWLSVLSGAVIVLRTICFTVVLRQIVLVMGSWMLPNHSSYYLARLMMGGSSLVVVTMCLWVLRTVFHHLCMYDLYRSAEPKNDAAMTLLGVLVPVLETFFVLYVRRLDGGMPPRRDGAGRTQQQPEQSADPVYDSPDVHYEQP